LSDGSKTGQTRLWLITGDPGSGKSSAVSRILLLVRSQGFTVGGILTREVRSHGQREGFSITNLATDETGTLASAKGIVGPRVGKYHVDLKILSSMAVTALEHARDKSDLVACDEVGPMELLSPEFRKAVMSCILQSHKPSICVIHKRLVDPLIEDLRNSEDSKLIEVTYENRNTLPDEIAEEIIDRLRPELKG